jgi:eukaryotic-like serine/threonine-protein kinase
VIGETLGNFRILSKLGDGGMGSVYRATDEMLDREVAIKVLKPELARQAALIERFRQEAIALARLNHPRIAALHGLQRHGEELLMVMEFLPGETLEAIVQHSGRIGWTRASELCMDVLEALDHAHDKGVVHRDIKPANAMLGRDGRVKVMDFGIARLKDKNRQTRMGHAVGTPMYMSPEQLRGEEVDGRADLYAVGAVLFELVTGRMAFEAESDYELMMKQLNEPPPSASALVRDVPSAIDAIIATSMAKRREERYPNALAMRDALQRAVGAITAESRKPRTPAPETRLVVDAVSTAEHASPPPVAAPIATRLAGTAGRPAETRLASAHVPLSVAGAAETRLSSTPGHSEVMHPEIVPWFKDWRIWLSAAGLLFAVGIAVRTFSSTPEEVVPPSGPGSTIAAEPTTGTRQAADSVPRSSPPPATVAASDPARPAAQPEPVVVSPPPVVTRNTAPVGGSANRDRNAKGRGTDTRTPARQRAVDTATTPPERVPVVTPPPPPPVEEKKEAPPPAREPENESGAAAAVSGAIGDFAGAVSGGNVGAVQGVLRGDGDFASTFLGLMREGRLQMSVAGEPSINLDGARASARFSASLNVRSPFGANRRRSASFSAELARSGGSWRMVSVRPTGAVDLK